jgi:hypothetical protein
VELNSTVSVLYADQSAVLMRRGTVDALLARLDDHVARLEQEIELLSADWLTLMPGLLATMRCIRDATAAPEIVDDPRAPRVRALWEDAENMRVPRHVFDDGADAVAGPILKIELALARSDLLPEAWRLFRSVLRALKRVRAGLRRAVRDEAG